MPLQKYLQLNARTRRSDASGILMINKTQKMNSEGGFALIALAIFLIVLGLALSMYVYGLNAQKELVRQEETNFAFSSVMNKMGAFIAIEGRYPCPARRDENPGSANYGIETDCTDTSVAVGSCGDGYCVTDRLTKRIRIGIVPFKTIGVDRNDATDSYGNFLTYALMEEQGDFATYDPDAGTIQIEEEDLSGGSAFSDVGFTLVSHGEDGRGSYNVNGIADPDTCVGSHDDVENCDNDANFLSKPFSNSQGPGHFDDQVEFILNDWVYIWDSAFGDFETSYGRNNADVGIGTDDPQEKLHIGGGGNLRIENGSLHTMELCDVSESNCFNPNVLGGTVAAGEGMDCLAGDMLMTDIVTAAPTCALFYGNATGSCSGNSFVSQMAYAGGGVITVTCTNALTGATSTFPLN